MGTMLLLSIPAVLVTALAAGSAMYPQAAHRPAPGHGRGPVLENTCLITADVRLMVDFYESILRQKAKWSGNDYAQFATAAGTLAIFSAEAQEKYIPGSAESARNRSVIVEFKVANVDQEYRRLQGRVKTWVKPPTTQPWGARSIYSRDPDGNLVDFFSQIRPSQRP